MERDRDPRTNRSFDRRGWLRLCGLAALGLGGAASTGAAATDGWRTVTVVGTTDRTSTYELTVSGSLVAGPGTDALSTTGTRGKSAEGALGEKRRHYRFTGELLDVRTSGDVEVFVDGRRLDPAVLQH